MLKAGGVTEYTTIGVCAGAVRRAWRWWTWKGRTRRRRLHSLGAGVLWLHSLGGFDEGEIVRRSGRAWRCCALHECDHLTSEDHRPRPLKIVTEAPRPIGASCCLTIEPIEMDQLLEHRKIESLENGASYSKGCTRLSHSPQTDQPS